MNGNGLKAWTEYPMRVAAFDGEVRPNLLLRSSSYFAYGGETRRAPAVRTGRETLRHKGADSPCVSPGTFSVSRAF